jgi:hypothetical protein
MAGVRAKTLPGVRIILIRRVACTIDGFASPLERSTGTRVRRVRVGQDGGSDDGRRQPAVGAEDQIVRENRLSWHMPTSPSTGAVSMYLWHACDGHVTHREQNADARSSQRNAGVGTIRSRHRDVRVTD